MRDLTKAIHTYPLHIEYHRCPKCGWIIESRQQYEQRFEFLEKDLECDRCENKFTEKKLHQ